VDWNDVGGDLKCRLESLTVLSSLVVDDSLGGVDDVVSVSSVWMESVS